MKCDIIIPIYNAYDCLTECIDSVIKNTDLKENRLILINDKSTDERVEKLLKEYGKKYSAIKILTNDENLGFVGTVNRGMRLSKNDVLLLNSDTVVTKNWLKKIKECAYSQPMVATVTPLSNNATLASVPKIFEDNKLPKGISIEEMGEIVERCSYNDYPELPTGHGFCLYIKREALNQVGYFDEESFGKGYGEENDFCFRCFDVGYRHLLCDNTYIYHKESQSFSEEKDQLRERAQKILEERYPNYENALKHWLSTRPIKYIGNNVGFEMGQTKTKPNILCLIHDWKNVDEHVGGTTLQVYDLIKKLRNKYNFHVLAPEDGIYKLHSYWSESESIIKYPGFQEFKNYGFYNSVYKEMVEEITQNFGISAIHINHMKGHYFDIVDIATEKKIPFYFSVHDFYAVCPITNKLYVGQSYCGNPTEKKCRECLRNYQGLVQENRLIDNWHKVWSPLLSNAEMVIAPSESAKEEILLTYKDMKITAIEHGVDLERQYLDLTVDDGSSMNIAFVGVMAKHKGRDIMFDLVKKKRMKNVKIHLFGSIQEETLGNSKYFVNHGPYNREDLPKLLKEHNIKLVCMFSIWPETYSYTLTESISAGVPVLAINLGAVGERIQKYKLGWVISPNTPKENYAEEIEKVLSHPREYSKVLKSIREYKIKTTGQMADDYDKVYSKVVKELSVQKTSITALLKNTDRYFSTNATPSYPDYSWVFGTLKWRIIEKFKIPKCIKDLYRKIKNRG